MGGLRILSGIALTLTLATCGSLRSASPPSPTFQGENPDTASTPFDNAPLDPDIAWFEYKNEMGVSIMYPANWTPEHTENGAVFVSPAGTRILWEVYPKPGGKQVSVDPNKWVPNEGGYEVHWSKNISIPHAEGYEFIWGVYQEDSWGVAPQLMVILYSEEKELDIRLSTFFDSDTIVALDELGPELTISSKFEVFLRMLDSLQIVAD